jgi:uncharacterized protein
MPFEPSCSTAEPFPCPIPDRIPLFPLPNIVFFPKTYLPLHIFEPRYRWMVIDASETGHCIGMALLKEGWQEQYYGNPPIYDLGCVGRVVSVQNLTDGRSNIVLHGLCRYRIVEEELDRTPYRQARVVPVEETPEGLTRELRADLLVILQESLVHRDGDQAWGHALETELSDDVLVNSLSASLDFTPLEKQLLLEADSLRRRARRLGDLLHFKRYERNDRKGRG